MSSLLGESEAVERILGELFDAVDDVVYVIDADGNSAFWNDKLEETTGYTAAEIAEMEPEKFLPPEQREFTPGLGEAIEALSDRRMVLDIVTRDGEAIPHEFRGTTIEDPETGAVYRCGIARDVSERVEREQALQQRRDDLETLNRINELLLTIVRELVETSDRRTFERTICERLADSELYRFAWIGEREMAGEYVRPRVSAGDEDGDVEDLFVGEETAAGHGPIRGAVQTGEVQVTNVDEPSFEPWREAAARYDVRSVAAIPLRHGETVYGVLAVYATRPDAFSDREQAGFRIIGETVGFVINAAKRRKQLFADEVAELEFELSGGESLFAELAAALDGEVTLEGYVDREEGWVAYLEVPGVPPEAVVEWLETSAGVADVRVVGDPADGSRFEVTLTDAVLFEATTAVGGTVTGATAVDGAASVVVEVPVDVDVRETVELLVDRLSGARLQAQRTRERKLERFDQPDDVVDALTDRQVEALTVAYRAGYYEWPRESTAEEVAATLGIAPATLHGHLRKAERTLLEALLDGE